MNTLALYGLVGVLCCFAVWLGFRYARKAGAAQARSKGQEKVIENVDKAKRAVNDLAGDSDARRKLRTRHTRD